MLLTTASDRSLSPSLEPSTEPAMVKLKHKRASVNGVNLHYVTVGSGPAVLCLHGWPQNHREFLPFFRPARTVSIHRARSAGIRRQRQAVLRATCRRRSRRICWSSRGVEGVDRFHILSHDLGGPPSVALAYMAGDRALSLATIETPFFGLDYPRLRRSPRVPIGISACT